MNYQETLDWMFSKLPMYQRQGKTAFKKDLTNILAFSEYLQNPHKKFKSIHVAGTNGKGSTSHMIASILQEAGYKVGLYTSPHLKDFRERIKINGEMISEQEIIDFIEENEVFLDKQKLSFFEMTVGLAFYYFAKAKVDIAVIEVGLGGRLDSTNIIQPEVSVITNIGLDHTQFLGETIREIAFEKAGIIKKGIPVIVGEKEDVATEVFIEISNGRSAPLIFAEIYVKKDFSTDLLGSYQQKNIKTAVAAIHSLRAFNIEEDNIRSGLLKVVKNTGLMGRWQVLHEQPKVVCDTAHNKEGLSQVLKQLLNEEYEKLHIVLGVVNDKKLDDILLLFPERAVYYFCKPQIPRGLNAHDLHQKAAQFNLKGEVFSSVKQAYKNALERAAKNDLIYVGGSTFVVAEVV
ncbi:MAG: bifunctional folylpolyglutamate synthase/dihydrofolate synthase [Flavobacteriaceae bacterium]|nr:bifunctional folylpolyglutamate synthase/dihydrofolate synthase [Flavobacteriaceae bacterium]